MPRLHSARFVRNLTRYERFETVRFARFDSTVPPVPVVQDGSGMQGSLSAWSTRLPYKPKLYLELLHFPKAQAFGGRDL